MAKVRYLSSTKKPGLRFRILSKRMQDPSDPQNVNMFLMLEGSHGVTFERMVNEEILTKYGYAVEVVDDSPPPQE